MIYQIKFLCVHRVTLGLLSFVVAEQASFAFGTIDDIIAGIQKLDLKEKNTDSSHVKFFDMDLGAAPNPDDEFAGEERSKFRLSDFNANSDSNAAKDEAEQKKIREPPRTENIGDDHFEEVSKMIKDGLSKAIQSIHDEDDSSPGLAIHRLEKSLKVLGEDEEVKKQIMAWEDKEDTANALRPKKWDRDAIFAAYHRLNDTEFGELANHLWLTRPDTRPTLLNMMHEHQEMVDEHNIKEKKWDRDEILAEYHRLDDEEFGVLTEKLWLSRPDTRETLLNLLQEHQKAVNEHAKIINEQGEMERVDDKKITASLWGVNNKADTNDEKKILLKALDKALDAMLDEQQKAEDKHTKKEVLKEEHDHEKKEVLREAKQGIEDEDDSPLPVQDKSPTPEPEAKPAEPEEKPQKATAEEMHRDIESAPAFDQEKAALLEEKRKSEQNLKDRSDAVGEEEEEEVIAKEEEKPLVEEEGEAQRLPVLRVSTV